MSCTTATYTYGNALVRKDGEYPMFDGLGSQRTTTNSSGILTGTATFEAFGTTVATNNGSHSPYQFAATSGYRTDGDAGLSLNRVIGELAASKLVQVPGRQTFTQELFNQMHYAATATTAALALVLLAIVVVIAAIIGLFMLIVGIGPLWLPIVVLLLGFATAVAARRANRA